MNAANGVSAQLRTWLLGKPRCACRPERQPSPTPAAEVQGGSPSAGRASGPCRDSLWEARRRFPTAPHERSGMACTPSPIHSASAQARLLDAPIGAATCMHAVWCAGRQAGPRRLMQAPPSRKAVPLPGNPGQWYPAHPPSSQGSWRWTLACMPDDCLSAAAQTGHSAHKRTGRAWFGAPRKLSPQRHGSRQPAAAAAAAPPSTPSTPELQGPRWGKWRGTALAGGRGRTRKRAPT